MNPAAEKLTGYRLDEVRNRSLHQVVHHTRPDGRPYPSSECPIDRAFPERNRIQGEEMFVHKDGHFYPIAFTASPIRIEATPVGTILEVRCIREQKQYEAHLRRQADQLRALARTAVELTAAPSLEAKLQVLTDSARMIIGAHQSVVSLTRGSDWSQSINAVSLSEKYARWRNLNAVPDGTGIYAVVCEQNQPMRLTQVELESHPQWKAFGAHAAEHPPLLGWLAAPLIGRDGRNLGLIQLSDKEDGEFDESDEAILVQLAQLSSTSIEQAQAESDLRDSEIRLRATVHGSPFPIMLHAEDGEVLALSRSWTELTGYTPEEIPTHFAWIRMAYPDRYQEVEAGLAAEFSSSSIVRRGEFKIQTKWGWTRIWDFQSVPLGRLSDGRRLQISAAVDVTERKDTEAQVRESQERFRLMADSIDQMIWVARPDGFHEYFNKRWYDYTGVPAGSTDGEGWSGMFHPDDQPRAWERWRRSLETGEPYEIEYRLRHWSGEYRWVLGRALAVRNEPGQILRWFGTCTDIHNRKRAQDERDRLLNAAEQARADAEAANRMKDEFLATLSHELRTPLNAILGWARILRSGKIDDDDLAEGLEAIERNSTVQAKLIEDLLDISRIISGNLRLEVQSVHLIEVIEAAVAAVTPAAEAKAIRLTRVLDSLAGPVSGDPARIQQIVWNLLSNAVKFTPKGGRVQILLERVNSHVEITVSDNGMGIGPEFLPHVFERFRQADGTTTRRYGGLGLGLSIVKQLTDLHGGTVRVKSRGEGQGATFTVALPLTVVRSEQVHDRKLPEDLEVTFQGQQEPLTGVRVLVVDDEPDARHLIQRVLTECDAQVALAASVEEALNLLEQFQPHVLLSDIGMPDQDGYDLIRQVRAHGYAAKDLPAAALTAFARSEDRRRALLAGFQTHVAKPVDPAELMAVVASLAGRTGGS